VVGGGLEWPAGWDSGGVGALAVVDDAGLDGCRYEVAEHEVDAPGDGDPKVDWIHMEGEMRIPEKMLHR
jgi:hypothetical protein